MGNTDARRLPIVALGAEHLAIGHLMRRNILAYKAPPNTEGYDLVCIHPNPRHKTRQIRVQVKSRYQADGDGTFLIKKKSFKCFDYIILVFLKIGNFYRKKQIADDSSAVEFYTLPVVEAKKLYQKAGWEKLCTHDKDLSKFKNEKGFERIAIELGIEHPSKAKRKLLQ